MNMLPNEAMNFINSLSERIKTTENEVILCVPYTDLFYSLLTAQGTNIKIGAQNMHWEETGAYTGEVSGKMLEVIGVNYVIIGHSERRKYFNETDGTVNKKVKSALNYGIKPIICIGETLEEKEQGNTNQVVTTQIGKALENISSNEINNCIIAYEPIWAIGTGKTATSKDANNTIKEIRKKVKEIYGEEISNNIQILYGGSVKPDTAKQLFEESDIDGALIGGASLNVKEFEEIINYSK